jgi:hypothetical protein
VFVEAGWQRPFTQALHTLLYPDERVLALVLYGSAQREGTVDRWSDVDVLVVVREIVPFETVNWLRPLGNIYAYEQNRGEWTYTIRLCFADMRRVDVMMMTEQQLTQYCERNLPRFWQPQRVLWAKTAVITNLLTSLSTTSSFSLPTTEQFNQMVEQFWYRSTIAVYKVIRRDLLIALHLALELQQDCLVLGMMLLDRVEQTNHHRSGGMGNQFVEKLSVPASFSAEDILHMIAAAAQLFDELAGRWSKEYVERQQPILTWIAAIKPTS